MNENMRIVFEIGVTKEISSIEEINEEELPVLDLLKSEGIPYEISICSKINYENFDYWSDTGRYDNYYVVCVPEEYIERILRDFPKELFHITPKFSELPVEEQKRINDVESELCVEDDFADVDLEELAKELEKIETVDKKKEKIYSKIYVALIIWLIIGVVLLAAQHIILGVCVISAMLIPCLRN